MPRMNGQMGKGNETAEALSQTLISPNESDSNWEAANLVDGLFAIANALHRIAAAMERPRPEGARCEGGGNGRVFAGAENRQPAATCGN